MNEQKGMATAWIILSIVAVIVALGIGYYFYQVNQTAKEEEQALQESTIEKERETIEAEEETTTEDVDTNWKEVAIAPMGFEIILTDNWSGYQWEMKDANTVDFSLPVDDSEDINRIEVLQITRRPVSEASASQCSELDRDDDYVYYSCGSVYAKNYTLENGEKVEQFVEQEVVTDGEVLSSFKLI